MMPKKQHDIIFLKDQRKKDTVGESSNENKAGRSTNGKLLMTNDYFIYYK